MEGEQSFEKGNRSECKSKMSELAFDFFQEHLVENIEFVFADVMISFNRGSEKRQGSVLMLRSINFPEHQVGFTIEFSKEYIDGEFLNDLNVCYSNFQRGLKEKFN